MTALFRNAHRYTPGMSRELSQSRLISANEYRRVRWRNGAGWTREIHAGFSQRTAHHDSGLAAETHWDWRLSIAEIEQDAPFSTFPGIERELVLLSGNGLRLRFEDGRTPLLEPPHGRCRFAGEHAVTGELVDGPTHDFNLMWRRDAVAAQLWHRPLVGPMVIFVDPGSTWAIYLIAGDARIGGDARLPPMTTGDTALLEAGAARARYVLEGGGEVLLVRVERS